MRRTYIGIGFNQLLMVIRNRHNEIQSVNTHDAAAKTYFRGYMVYNLVFDLWEESIVVE